MIYEKQLYLDFNHENKNKIAKMKTLLKENMNGAIR